MRKKLRKFLIVHEKVVFRSIMGTMVFGSILIGAISAYDPVESFLNGTSSRLDGYGVGPVMSGTK